MNEKLKLGIAAALALVLGIGIYLADSRNTRFENEELEIKGVLESVYAAETRHFKEKSRYTDEYELIETLPQTRRPTFAGIFPDCKEPDVAVPHVFLGPSDENFRETALRLLDDERLQGRCSNLEEGSKPLPHRTSTRIRFSSFGSLTRAERRPSF